MEGHAGKVCRKAWDLLAKARQHWSWQKRLAWIIINVHQKNSTLQESRHWQWHTRLAVHSPHAGNIGPNSGTHFVAQCAHDGQVTSITRNIESGIVK